MLPDREHVKELYARFADQQPYYSAEMGLAHYMVHLTTVDSCYLDFDYLE